MKTSRLDSYYGTRYRAWKVLHDEGWTITRQALYQWGEYPPKFWQKVFQGITKGKLKVTK